MIRMKINPLYFYKNALIEAPYNLPHRQIKLLTIDPITKDEVWIKLFGCHDIECLRKKLVYFAPIKAYISVSCYLDPERAGLMWKQKVGEYRYLPNILLSSDFVMDFDHGVISLLNLLRSYDFLKDKGYKKFKSVETKRGFHLWGLDWYAQECQERVKNGLHKPFAREKFILSKKIDLCDELESYGIEFDKPISMDTRRIVKLWGSLSDDTFVCRAWDDPNLMAKEFINSKAYLPNITSNQARADADLAQ